MRPVEDRKTALQAPIFRLSGSWGSRRAARFFAESRAWSCQSEQSRDGLYATYKPCPMCAGAILNGGVKTLVLGARNRAVQKFSGNAFQFNEYSVDTFAKLTGWDLTVIEGVLEEECVALIARLPSN